MGCLATVIRIPSSAGTGGIVFVGGTGGQSLPLSVVRGTLRDVDAGFPDYTPRLDAIMGDASGIVEGLRGVAYTRNHNDHDQDQKALGATQAEFMR